LPVSDPSPDFDELLDPEFLSKGPKEASAEERIARASGIARGNERLKRQGEISDGVGKPKYGRARKSAPWIVIGAVIGVTILVFALLVR
jgi:hypothetical protein